MTKPLLALACALIFQVTGRSAVVVSTFGPGDTFDTTRSNAVSGTSSPIGSFSVANPFTSPFSGTVTSIDVAVTLFSGSGDVALYLYQNDPATGLPSTSAARLFLGDLTAVGNPGSVLSLTLAGNAAPALLANQTYWLGMIAADPNSNDGWNAALSGSAGSPSAFSRDGGMTFSAGSQSDAFRINATQVPEPSAWAWLVLGGSVAFVAAQRRTRNVMGE